MNVCASVGGRNTINDKSMAVSVVGFVVEISAEDFNVASKGGTVNGQGHGGRGSFQEFVNDLISGSGGNASAFHFNVNWQNWRSSPLAGDDFPVGLRGNSNGTIQVLEIVGLVCSLGIQRISGVRACERERDSSGIIDTRNRDGISGLGAETREVDSGVVARHGGWGSSSGGVCDSERDGLSAGIGPGQAQIEDVVGVIRSESTSGEVVGEVDGCRRQRMGHCDGNCAGDGNGIRIGVGCGTGARSSGRNRDRIGRGDCKRGSVHD